MNNTQSRQLSRKLSPIYDALDARNFKLAIKLSSKKDIADIPAVIVLRAYSLQVSGRRDEARELVDRVALDEAVLRDTGTLSTVELIYRLSGRFSKTIAVYEKAVSLAPKDESLATALLHAYVRDGRFDKLQLLGMKMRKTFKKDEYAVWSIVGILLQHEFRDKSHQRLKLAKAICEKLPNDISDLKIQILKALGDYEACLPLVNEQRQSAEKELVESTVKERTNALRAKAADLISHEAHIRTAMGDHDGAAKCCWEYLTSHDHDDWSKIRGYIDAALQTSGSREVHDQITSLNDSRGSMWGRLYFNYTECSKGACENACSTYVKGLLAYVESFGNNASCFCDIQRFYVPALIQHSASPDDADCRRVQLSKGSLAALLERDFLHRISAPDDPAFLLTEVARKNLIATLGEMESSYYDAAIHEVLHCTESTSVSKAVQRYVTVLRSRVFLVATTMQVLKSRMISPVVSLICMINALRSAGIRANGE